MWGLLGGDGGAYFIFNSMVLVLFTSMSLLNNIIRVATVHTSPGVGAAVIYFKGFLGVGGGGGGAYFIFNSMVLVLFNSMSLLNNIIGVTTVHTSPGVGAAVVLEIAPLLCFLWPALSRCQCDESVSHMEIISRRAGFSCHNFLLFPDCFPFPVLLERSVSRIGFCG